jgi:hypothetical protein
VCQPNQLGFIGMFFADSIWSMAIALKLVDQPGEANLMTAEVDYSIYTLWQLLAARYESDVDGHVTRVRWLEAEIQKRCGHVQDPTKRRGSSSAATGSRRRYRPYGIMLGVFFLVVSSGPFLAVEFLDTMNLVIDVNGDNALLSGVWAMLTLPFAVMVFLIGGIMDAERVVKWFNL